MIFSYFWGRRRVLFNLKERRTLKSEIFLMTAVLARPTWGCVVVELLWTGGISWHLASSGGQLATALFPGWNLGITNSRTHQGVYAYETCTAMLRPETISYDNGARATCNCCTPPLEQI